MPELQFFVPGQPCGKPAPRAGKGKGGHPQIFAGPRNPLQSPFALWAATVRLAAERAVKGDDSWPAAKGVPLCVYIRLGMKEPLNYPKTKVKRHVTRPDVDNCAKGILDAIHGVVFMNDSQIVSLSVQKDYSSVPGAVITTFEADA